jgi:hypothetical protein
MIGGKTAETVQQFCLDLWGRRWLHPAGPGLAGVLEPGHRRVGDRQYGVHRRSRWSSGRLVPPCFPRHTTRRTAASPNREWSGRVGQELKLLPYALARPSRDGYVKSGGAPIWALRCPPGAGVPRLEPRSVSATVTIHGLPAKHV